jgi:hypothetical protein
MQACFFFKLTRAKYENYSPYYFSCNKLYCKRTVKKGTDFTVKQRVGQLKADFCQRKSKVYTK